MTRVFSRRAWLATAALVGAAVTALLAFRLWTQTPNERDPGGAGAGPTADVSWILAPATPNPGVDPPDEVQQRIATVQQLHQRLNRADVEVGSLASALGPDVDRTFEYVRDAIRYEPYAGVLRGARGALLGSAGNAADKSALLAALLRAQGFAVQFATGRLDEAGARRLAEAPLQPPRAMAEIQLDLSDLDPHDEAAERLRQAYDARKSAFELLLARVEHDRAVLQRASGGLQMASVTPDALAADAREHVWVQVNRGGWVDLDPSFPDAVPGRAFVPVARRFDELPDALYHTITFRVKIEQQRGTVLQERTLVEVTRRTADLAGVPVVFANIPNLPSDDFTLARVGEANRFLPVLKIRGEEVTGSGFDLRGNPVPASEFSDLRSPLPFDRIASALDTLLSGGGAEPAADAALASESLELVTSGPNGPTRSYLRWIVDRIGVDRRGTQNPPSILPEFKDETRLRYQLTAQQTILVEPGFLNPTFLTDALLRQTLNNRDLLAATIQYATEDDGSNWKEVERLRDAQARSDESTSIEVLALSAATKDLGDRVVATRFPGASYYRAFPGITIFKTAVDRTAEGHVAVRQVFDIVEHSFRTVARDASARNGLATSLGVLQTHLERALALDYHRALERQLTGRPELAPELRVAPAAVNAVDVFARAQERGVPSQLLTPSDRSKLESLQISAAARARVRQELDRGFAVLVPSSSVDLAGTLTVGWWRIDPATGNVLGVMESGEGQAYLETLINNVRAIQGRLVIWLLLKRAEVSAVLFTACVSSAVTCAIGTLAGRSYSSAACMAGLLVCPIAQSWIGVAFSAVPAVTGPPRPGAAPGPGTTPTPQPPRPGQPTTPGRPGGSSSSPPTIAGGTGGTPAPGTPGGRGTPGTPPPNPPGPPGPGTPPPGPAVGPPAGPGAGPRPPASGGGSTPPPPTPGARGGRGGAQPPSGAQPTAPGGASAPLRPDGIVDESTPTHYRVYEYRTVNGVQHRFHAKALVQREGNSRDITMDFDLKAQSDPAARSTIPGYQHFPRILQKFAGDFDAIRGLWGYRDNLTAFNDRVRVWTAANPGKPPPPEVLRDAALNATNTGRWARDAGYRSVEFLELNGEPGNYSGVDVRFSPGN